LPRFAHVFRVLRSLEAAPWYNGAPMGGIFDEVRGPTKIATWLKYARRIRPGILARWEMTEYFPGTKKEAYRRMEWDEETQEWVLKYHFHT